MRKPIKHYPNYISFGNKENSVYLVARRFGGLWILSSFQASQAAYPEQTEYNPQSHFG